MKKNRILKVIFSTFMAGVLIIQNGTFAGELIDSELSIDLSDELALSEAPSVMADFSDEVDFSDMIDIVDTQENIEVPSSDDEISEVVDLKPDMDEPFQVDMQENDADTQGELSFSEIDNLFVEGYVRLKEDCVVYANESGQEELGTFSGETIVYANISSYASEESDGWLKIIYDSVEAKEVNEPLMSGYVQFKDASALSDEEVEHLVVLLMNDNNVRNYNEILIPVVNFKSVEVDEAEIVEEIEITDEEVIASSVEDENAIVTEENVLDEVNASSTETVEITAQPVSLETELGQTVYFEVEASGDGLTYQWQISTDGGESWNNTTLVGSKTKKLKVVASKGRTGYQFRCVVTGSADSVTSAPAVLTITGVAKITAQPESIVTEVGETVYFEIGTFGEGLTYQWQISNDDGATWNNTTLVGSKTKKLKVVASKGRNGYQFRCVVKGSENSVTSNPAVLTINGIVEITTQPMSLEAELGETVYFEVGATGEELTYQWQLSKDDGVTWNNTTLVGSKTKKLTVVASKGRNGYQFRCVVKGSANSVTSNPAVLTINGIVEITTQPMSIEAELGETVYFEVGASGEELTYQWQISNDDGATWNNTTLVGSKTNRLKVVASKGRNGYQFRCVVKGSANSVTSNPAVLTINGIVEITTQPVSLEAELGETVYFEVGASGEELTYQWQISNDGGVTWNNTTLVGSKTKKLKVVASKGRNGYQFRCVVKGKANSVTSNPAVLTINGIVEILSHPVSLEVEVGATVYFEVEAVGEGLTYQWQISKDDGETWADTTLVGSKTKKLKVVASKGRNGYQFRCVVTGSVYSVTSDPAVLTVDIPIVYDDVTYEPITPTTCKVVSYAGTASTLIIPETIEGMTVIEIGVEAFMNNTSLVSIDLPDTIEVIRARAFKGCSSLSDMH